MPLPDPDEQFEFEESLNERRLLNQLRLRSFTVSPATIHAFEQATLAWDVAVPASVTAEIEVSFTLGGTPVPHTGSLLVSPLATGAFQLVAHSTRTKRILGTRIVEVDATDCQEGSLPRASIEFRVQTVKDLFRAGSLSSRGDIAISMRPPDALLIEVPLRASIPNFFDADIDVDLTVAISAVSQPGGRRLVAVKLRDVSVDVIFHLAEHILSLGSATAAQAIIQPLAADLIRSFLGAQIESVVRAPLQDVVDILLVGWRGNDPAKREHRLFSITSEPEPAGLIIIGCPLPPPPPPPPVVDE